MVLKPRLDLPSITTFNNTMKKILIFGSEDFEYDSGAVALTKHLKDNIQEVTVQKLSRPEQLMNFLGSDFIIIDVATGIDEPLLIRDLDKINYGKKVTAHDMDLGAFLKTLKELGELDEVNIVAIPNDKDSQESLPKVMELLKNII